MTSKTIAIFLFEDVEELDAVGPYEVLGAWCAYFGGDGYQLICVSADGAPVRGAKGLGMSADCSIADAPPLDVLVIRAEAALAGCCANRRSWTGCARPHARHR